MYLFQSPGSNGRCSFSYILEPEWCMACINMLWQPSEWCINGISCHLWTFKEILGLDDRSVICSCSMDLNVRANIERTHEMNFSFFCGCAVGLEAEDVSHLNIIWTRAMFKLLYIQHPGCVKDFSSNQSTKCWPALMKDIFPFKPGFSWCLARHWFFLVSPLWGRGYAVSGVLLAW